MNEAKYPFELHITVKTPGDLDQFRATCLKLGVKPVFIDYQLQLGSTIDDVMTSNRWIDSYDTVVEYSAKIKKSLEQHGYNVCRIKIETIPTHPEALQQTTFTNQYYEAHVAIRTTPHHINNISNVCKYHHAHMSRNPFKVIDQSIVQMCTIRTFEANYDKFTTSVYALIQDLTHYGTIDKPELEFAIYDSNITHDSAWIST